MKKQGAEIVEGIKIAEIDEIPASALGGCNRFKHDLKAYLARLGPGAPMKSLDDIVASQKFHPSVEKALLASQAASDLSPDQNPKCQEVTEIERRLAEGVLRAMDGARLDVLVFPSWNFPPRVIGDLNTPHGNNSPRIAPPTGFPAVTVPMGFARTTLPAGIQILGRPWSESTLFKIAYGYEQATLHRRSPPNTPALP
jgi:amidase